MSPLDLHTPLGVSLALLPEVVLSTWLLVVLLVVAWRHERGRQLPRRLAESGRVLLASAALATLWVKGRRPRRRSPYDRVGPVPFRRRRRSSGRRCRDDSPVLRYVDRQRLLAPEYYVLILLATVGMLFLAGAEDLIVLFLGLELMSIAVYVLTGFDRFRRSSAEAALKYFLIGAFASAFLLYGIALVYGATGETNLSASASAWRPAPLSLMAALGLGLLLIGFGFKVAAVPFHMWAPDVYDGAPTPITGFMATGVKTAAFAALVRLLLEGFPTATAVWQPIVAAIALATIVLGNRSRCRSARSNGCWRTAPSRTPAT